MDTRDLNRKTIDESKANGVKDEQRKKSSGLVATGDERRVDSSPRITTAQTHERSRILPRHGL
jgi:hypothetical protein